jgi:hypothetical protein
MSVRLDNLIPAAWEGWGLLFELASDIGEGWTIVGGQMVQVLAAEYGASDRVRPTEDMDVLVDVRARRDGTEQLGRWLVEHDVLHEGYSPDGIGHRYTRVAVTGPGKLIVDVLAPEGLGERANLTTTPPARTIQVPGGTQALGRSEAVEVTITDFVGAGERTGTVLRPTLVAAIIAKAAATTINVRTAPERDWQDAALMLSLVSDPFAAAEGLTAKDRRRLAELAPLTQRGHVGWALLDDESYRRGIAALDALVGAAPHDAQGGEVQGQRIQERGPKYQ